MRLEKCCKNILLEQSKRPLISFCLVAFNQEQYIRQAIDGAFSQTYQPLEIILSDDKSSDKTYEIMVKMANNYCGNHKIILNQNKNNLGLCGNINRILDLSSGEIIVVAGGDDISLPTRVEKSWQYLNDNPDAFCISFQLQKIDKYGNKFGKINCNDAKLNKFSLNEFIQQKGFHINGPSRAFRRNVYEEFGELNPQAQTEDTTILMRCLMMGNAILSNDIEVYYRVHGENYFASDRKFLIKYENIYQQYLKDIRLALEKNIITNEQSKILRKILWRKIKIQILRSGYFKSNSKLLYFLFHIILSSHLGFRSKLKYLFETFRR